MGPNAVTYMMHIELFVYLRPTGFGEVLGHSVLTDRVHLVVFTIVQMRLHDGSGVFVRRARSVRGRLLIAQTMLLHVCGIVRFTWTH